MQIEIIAIGDEVVKGYTVNTNASYIAKRLQDLGMNSVRHTAVCDDEKSIKEVVEASLKRSDLLFVIGGLGPTEDDLTKEAVCGCMGKELVLYEDIFKGIQQYFAQSGRTTPLNNKKQAYFPEDAVILKNPNGTAPGCIVTSGAKQAVLLPGPPRELIPMVENEVIPYFEQNLDGVFETIDLKVFGIGESHLAEKLGEKLGVFEQVSVATYVGNNEIIVRIRAFGKNKEEAHTQAKIIEKEISLGLKEYIIGNNHKQLEENVVELLSAYGYTIATAESCTGGLLAGTLINCSGISEWLGESIVTYSNAAKMKYLDVQEETLRLYGAVSPQTAEEMARGIKKQAGVHIGLATTGIAGPDGGTEAKPVGTVYVGLAIGEACYTYHLQLDGSRQEIRQKAVKNVLYHLYRHLQKDSTCNS
ncbi:MAG: competence/damage-inducible protein A [Cellulosilyticaceae bacterium]